MDNLAQHGPKIIKKVLIANRGEIAVRIIRTCRDLGLRTVALFSDVDASSLHVRLADEAFHMPGSVAHKTYLNEELVLQALKESGADALHPGYGFLSEKADFVEAVTSLGVLFIGPSAFSMRLMGDKLKAREVMEKIWCQFFLVVDRLKVLQNLNKLQKKYLIR